MSDRKKDLLIYLFLFSLAFVVRLLLIAKGPFHMDTLELARNAAVTLDTLKLQYMHGGGYPLIVIIGTIFVFFSRLIGIADPVFSVNFMSVVFGSLDIIIFYLLSRKMLDRTGSLASSLILIFLPLHVSVSTFGMTHPISIFFNLLGVYFLFLYLEKYKMAPLIFSAISLGLGAASRLTDGTIIVAVIFLYLVQSQRINHISRKQLIYRMVAYLIIYSVVAFIFYLSMITRMGFSQFNNTANMYYYRHEWKALLYSFGLLKDILGVGGLILLAAGIIYLLIDKKYALLSFLSILFFSLFIYYGSVSMTEHRYMLLAIIPLLIMQGYFISKAIVIKRLRMLFVVVLFILIAVNFIDAYPMIKFRHDYSLQEEFAKFVKDNTEPQAYIIAMDEGPFIEYYAQRNVLYKATGIHREDFEQFFNRVDSLLMNEAQIYIISSGIYGYDPRKYFIDMLFDKYNLIYIGGSLNEDYHHKAIKQLLFLEELYKIEKKT